GIGALQAHDNGHRDVSDFLIRIDNALRHTVTTDNTAEDIDQDGLYIRVFQDDVEPGFDRLCIGGAAHIKEVGRLTTCQFDNVHRRHRQARPVDHTAYVTVEFHIVEIRLP